LCGVVLGDLPQIKPPHSVQELVQQVAGSELALLAAAGAPSLASTLRQSPQAARGGILVIGPEGDFTPSELEALLAAGALPVNAQRPSAHGHLADPVACPHPLY